MFFDLWNIYRDGGEVIRRLRRYDTQITFFYRVQ